METGPLGRPWLSDRGKAASPCTSPTHLMFHSNGFFLPKETVALPTLWFPSQLLLTLQGPAQMPLPLSNLSGTLWVRGQCTPLCVTVMSLNCGRSFVSLSPWWTGGSLPVSCIVVAQPRAWHVHGGVWEHFAEWILTQRKKQTSAEHLLWTGPMSANTGTAKSTVSAPAGHLPVSAQKPFSKLHIYIH